MSVNSRQVMIVKIIKEEGATLPFFDLRHNFLRFMNKKTEHDGIN